MWLESTTGPQPSNMARVHHRPTAQQCAQSTTGPQPSEWRPQAHSPAMWLESTTGPQPSIIAQHSGQNPPTASTIRRDSSGGRTSHRKSRRNTGTGSIPRSGKAFFSQSQLSVQTLGVQSLILKLPNSVSCTIAWPHGNIAHSGRNG